MMEVWSQAGGVAALKPRVEAQNLSVSDPSGGVYSPIFVLPRGGATLPSAGQNVVVAPPTVTSVAMPDPKRSFRFCRLKLLTAAGSVEATVEVKTESPAKSWLWAVNKVPPVAGPMA